MFKKLISNLPFNPSLLGQVSFYTKRLKEEQTIRRMGFLFMALALFIQMFAVIAPPQKSLAYSSADDYIEANGYSSKQSVLAAWDNPNKDVQAIYSHFGVTRDEIVNLSGPVTIVSTGGNYFTTGRTSVSQRPDAGSIKQKYKDSELPVTIGGETIYYRDLKSFDIKNPSNSYQAYQGTKANGSPFWILKDCGNFTNLYTPPSPPPTPPPAPTPHPEGYLDVNTCNGISGWAWNTVHERYVHIYVDQPAFGGAVKDRDYFEVNANLSRPDVHTARNDIDTNVGYTWDGGPLHNDNKSHHLWVYVTDRGNNYALLNGGENVAVNFTCPVNPPPSPTPVTPAFEFRKTIDGGARALKPGDEYSYRFEYRNSVPNSSNILGAAITDTFDLDHYTIVTSSVPIIFSGHVGYINLGTVAYSAQFQTAVIVTVKLKDAIPNGQNICNAASISAANATSVTSGGTGLCVGIVNPCVYNGSVPSGTDAACVPAVVCSLTQSAFNKTTKESTFTTTVTSTAPTLTPIKSYVYDFGDKSSKNNNSIGLTDTVKHVYKDGNYHATATVFYSINGIANSSHTAACAADVETKPDQPLSPSKSAQNISQKLNNADTMTHKANGGDIIEYTLLVHNSYDYDRANYTISDTMADVLDYTDVDLAFLQAQGGTFDGGTKTVTWVDQTIKANSDMIKHFRVTVKNPVPATNQPSQLTTSFDCNIVNTYGSSTVSIPINCPPAKTAEYLATTLPNTGPGTSVLIGAVMMMVVAYFFFRARLLGKEIELVRAEYATGGGF